MNRLLEEKDIDNCLALMELVKDDFAIDLNVILNCHTLFYKGKRLN